MPHAIVKLFPGRTEEQKKNLAARIAIDVVECLGCSPEAVSVSIEEVEREAWKDEVYLPEIIGKPDALYQAPGYNL